MSWNDHGIGTETAGADLLEGRRVTFNAEGEVVYAPLDDLGIGSTRTPQKSSEDVGVAYWNKPGTHHLTASDSFAVGQPVYAAAEGMVSALPVAAGDYIKVGVALEPAAEAGDVVEILPVESGKVVTVAG